MPDMPAGTLKTGAVTWEVTVSSGSHYFQATAPGMPLCTGATWAALENSCKVQASKAKVRVAVPYTRIEWRRGMPVLVNGTASSINSSTRKIMVREDGKSDQLSPFNEAFMPPDSDDAAEILRLTAVIQQADRELQEVRERYKFPAGSLGAEVAAQIDAATEARGNK